MANIGEITEIVNSTELQLKVGADVYILLTDLQVHVGRPEDRTPTTDGGALYTYGKGDHWMSFTLVASTPEIDSLAALNDIDTDGDLTSTAWIVVANNVAGASKTLTCTGFLREMDLRKTPEGKVMIDCIVRITSDTLAVA
jgi:hypothetical protein